MSHTYPDFVNKCKTLIENIEDLTPKPRRRTRHGRDEYVEDNPLSQSWTEGPFEASPIELEKMFRIFNIPMMKDYLAIQVYADRYAGNTKFVNVQAFASGKCPTCHRGDHTLSSVINRSFLLIEFKTLVNQALEDKCVSVVDAVLSE